jgi:hypothetical protein
MSIVKHMEAIFLGAATVVLVTAYASAAAIPAPATYESQVSVSDGKVATVVVTGKRLSVIEKARLAF